MSEECVQRRITSLWVSHASGYCQGSGGGWGGIESFGTIKRRGGIVSRED
jgi:hypothetical protein